jgi:hypothetical protein
MKIFQKQPGVDCVSNSYDTFTRGKNQDVFIKWPADNNPQSNELENNNKYVIGQLSEVTKIVFPDFYKKSTVTWWEDEITKYYNNKDGLRFNG